MCMHDIPMIQYEIELLNTLKKHPQKSTEVSDPSSVATLPYFTFIEKKMTTLRNDLSVSFFFFPITEPIGGCHEMVVD